MWDLDTLTAAQALDPVEQRVRAAVERAMKPYLELTATSVLDPESPPNPDAIATYQDVWTRAVDSVVMPELQAIASDAFLAAGGTLVAGALSAWVLSQLALVRGLLLELPTEVAGLLWKAIEQSQLEGDDAAALRVRIRRVLSWSRWEARADTIAITGTSQATNSGTLGAGLQDLPMARVDVRPLKVWISERDSRVRPTHKIADGQRRELWQPFTVGVALMAYPCDPTGPPGETINCRCRVELVDAPGIRPVPGRG